MVKIDENYGLVSDEAIRAGLDPAEEDDMGVPSRDVPFTEDSFARGRANAGQAAQIARGLERGDGLDLEEDIYAPE